MWPTPMRRRSAQVVAWALGSGARDGALPRRLHNSWLSSFGGWQPVQQFSAQPAAAGSPSALAAKPRAAPESAVGDNRKYVLCMFPYPSGRLHMGHVRVYALGDALARAWRMTGSQVLFPMGWDSFGLPAENAARQRGVEARAWTETNIEQMKAQLQGLNLSFDWDRELSTCEPRYFRWTQWIFLQMLDSGLAYRRKAEVNWDPVDCTVLANEQVDADGRSWRSGAVVERRMLEQWFLRITSYADDLLDGLDSDHVKQGWPKEVRNAQRRWIGRSAGAKISFSCIPTGVSSVDPNADANADANADPTTKENDVHVFTTRAETLFGVTFVALAPSHPLACRLAPVRSDAAERVRLEMLADSTVDASFDLGVSVAHPLTGAALPVIVASYVLDDHGEGAVMGVPAHDARDMRFAESHGFPVVPVLRPASHPCARAHARAGANVDSHANSTVNANANASSNACLPEAPVDVVEVLHNSGDFDGQSAKAARVSIVAALAGLDKGSASTRYRLRDWLVSRQRGWGTPIPVVHCDACGPVGVPEAELPVERPAGESLDAVAAWAADVVCPQCGGAHARRDTDTLDTFVDSSWYFLRFCDPHNAGAAADPAKAAQWMGSAGVHHYIGGVEHAVLHLLYARFVNRVLFQRGLAPSAEPFQHLLAQGMVLGRTARCPDTGRYLAPHEWTVSANGSAVRIAEVELGAGVGVGVGGHGGKEQQEKGEARAEAEVEVVPVNTAWEKMSKSKGNGQDPEDVIARFGVDATRLAVLFAAPPEQSIEWDDAALIGQSRFLARLDAAVEGLVKENPVGEEEEEEGRVGEALSKKEESRARAEHLRRKTHDAVVGVTMQLFEKHHLNVAIAELMTLLNEATQRPLAPAAARREALEALVKMLSPLAPTAADRLWSCLRQSSSSSSSSSSYSYSSFSSVHDEAWPTADAEIPSGGRTMPLVVQVSGKKRAMLEVEVGEEVPPIDRILVIARESVLSLLSDRTVLRELVVAPKPGARKPTYLVNFVLEKKRA